MMEAHMKESGNKKTGIQEVSINGKKEKNEIHFR